jgi:hypothetical protein
MADYDGRAETLAEAQEMQDAADKGADAPRICGTCLHRRWSECTWYLKNYGVAYEHEACHNWEPKPRREV